MFFFSKDKYNSHLIKLVSFIFAATKSSIIVLEQREQLNIEQTEINIVFLFLHDFCCIISINSIAL
jgi:hypothetical protein